MRKNVFNIVDAYNGMICMIKNDSYNMVFNNSRNWYKYSIAPIFYICVVILIIISFLIVSFLNVVDIIISKETYCHFNFNKLFYEEI